jgi:hypothetical protein
MCRDAHGRKLTYRLAKYSATTDKLLKATPMTNWPELRDATREARRKTLLYSNTYLRPECRRDGGEWEPVSID